MILARALLGRFPCFRGVFSSPSRSSDGETQPIEREARVDRNQDNLPLATTCALARLTSVAAPVDPSSPSTVLIVDAMDGTTRLQASLRRMGIKAIRETTGRGALQRLRDGVVSAVVFELRAEPREPSPGNRAAFPALATGLQTREGAAGSRKAVRESSPPDWVCEGPPGGG